MMNKKAVSDVVTTVLIILFGIVAVAIVGAIVINQVNKAGKSIDKSQVCFDNIVEPVSCVFTAVGAGGNTIVGFKRDSGDLKIKSINIVATPASGGAANIDGTPSGALAPSAPDLPKGNSFTITDTGRKLANVKVSATYYLVGTAGDTQTCTSQVLTCTSQ